MKATFLGHQSWLVSTNTTNILIDPVLYNSFGSDDDTAIEIFPPRSIDIKLMPKIDTIFLSHEHSDHFHIPTLRNFPNAPIIFGPLMADCVVQTIKHFGLKHKLLKFKKFYKIGDIEVMLFPADTETVFWESRVSQILLRPINKPEDSLFIAVDALVSKDFKNDIENERISVPKAIAVSNNSQFTPRGVPGSLDNFKDKSLTDNGVVGLSLLKELLVSYTEGLPEIDNIIICGGGFTKKYDTSFGPFVFSDQSKLACIANYFSMEKVIFGPNPGQVIQIDDLVSYVEPVSWVKLNQQRLKEIYEAGENFKKNPINIKIKPISDIKFVYKESTITEALNKIAKSFILSPSGELAIDFISTRQIKAPPYGFIIKLYLDSSCTNCRIYALDFNKAEFELLDEYLDESHVPFGVELFFNDFVGVINGDLQIWDLGGIGIRSWFIGSKLSSPVAFFYSYFGEQVQQDQNFKSFKKRWEKEELVKKLAS